MTLAQRFILKARELMPYQDTLQDLDPALDDEQAIDEVLFRRSEYLGGMAAVILELIKHEAAANPGAAKDDPANEVGLRQKAPVASH